MGCSVGQGFLFSHPLVPDDAGRMLEELEAVAQAAGGGDARDAATT
jgi:EAL domain-containing protein (putative c-di-GMP-specific phosphodiesterase class I)